MFYLVWRDKKNLSREPFKGFLFLAIHHSVLLARFCKWKRKMFNITCGSARFRTIITPVEICFAAGAGPFSCRASFVWSSPRAGSALQRGPPSPTIQPAISLFVDKRIPGHSCRFSSKHYPFPNKQQSDCLVNCPRSDCCKESISGIP